MTDIEKAENKIIRAYLDYFVLRYLCLPDEDEITHIEWWLSMTMFRNATDQARNRREKVMREYIAKRGR